MIFEFSAEARDQLDHWRRHDRSKLDRIRTIMRSIEADPRVGIGKPEQLRHQLAGWWSRRIDREHRFVYRVEGERCIVLSCRFHYE
jgi:toxin YoeB